MVYSIEAGEQSQVMRGCLSPQGHDQGIADYRTQIAEVRMLWFTLHFAF
jgi:hypothetical protein